MASFLSYHDLWSYHEYWYIYHTMQTGTTRLIKELIAQQENSYLAETAMSQ